MIRLCDIRLRCREKFSIARGKLKISLVALLSFNNILLSDYGKKNRLAATG